MADDKYYNPGTVQVENNPGQYYMSCVMTENVTDKPEIHVENVKPAYIVQSSEVASTMNYGGVTNPADIQNVAANSASETNTSVANDVYSSNHMSTAEPAYENAFPANDEPQYESAFPTYSAPVTAPVFPEVAAPATEPMYENAFPANDAPQYESAFPTYSEPVAAPVFPEVSAPVTAPVFPEVSAPVNQQPIYSEQPYAQPQPAYSEQTYAQPQPAYSEQPYAQSQPAYSEQPYAQPQPAYNEQPYAQPQPAYNEQPYAQPQPVYSEQPYVQSQPVYSEQPYAQPQPAYGEQPYAQSQPVYNDQSYMQPNPGASEAQNGYEYYGGAQYGENSYSSPNESAAEMNGGYAPYSEASENATYQSNEQFNNGAGFGNDTQPVSQEVPLSERSAWGNPMPTSEQNNGWGAPSQEPVQNNSWATWDNGGGNGSNFSDGWDDAGYAAKAPKQKKKKNLLLPIIVIGGFFGVLILAALIVLAILFGPKLIGNNAKSQDDIFISASYDKDGNAIVPMMNGEAYEYSADDVKMAVTGDRKNIIVIEEDGLYRVQASNGMKKKIDDEAGELFVLNNECIVYDNGHGYFLYEYKNDSKTQLDSLNENAIVDSSNGAYIAYENDKGEIYKLNVTSGKSEKVAKTDDVLWLAYISNDGKTIIWEDYDKEQLVINRDGASEKFSLTDYVYGIMSNKSEKCLIAYTFGRFYIISGKNDTLEVRVPGYINGLYTAKGAFADSSAEFEGLYVWVESKENSSEMTLYYVDKDGNLTEMLDDFSSIAVSNNHVFYTKGDNLYCEKLKKGSTSDKAKIDKNVQYILNAAGDYLYYTKDLDKSTVTLCGYKVGKDKYEITSGLDKYAGIYVGSDYKTVYYFEDLQNDTMNTMTYGDLWKSSYDGKKSEKIDTDVMYYSVEDGDNRRILKNKFIYKKYISTLANYEACTDWFYYDGKNSKIFAEDIIVY